MEKPKGLTLWTEWQKKAWARAVAEPNGAFPRMSGIGCPMRLKSGGRVGVCGSNLVDTPHVIQCGSEPRRLVRCDVCGNWMCRLLGTNEGDGQRWILE